MSPEIQTLVALALVGAAATWLVLRALGQRRKPGCGGGCGCTAGDLKAKARRRADAVRQSGF